MLAFDQYIEGGYCPGGHWAEWEFSFGEQPQQVFKIAEFAQIFYTAIQLTVMVGGNLAMQQYEGLENHRVQLCPIFDTWVQKYVTQRAIHPQFNLYNSPAAGPDLALA